MNNSSSGLGPAMGTRSHSKSPVDSPNLSSMNASSSSNMNELRLQTEQRGGTGLVNADSGGGCSVYFEELNEAPYNLIISDKCPSCNLVVGKHVRRPHMAQVAPVRQADSQSNSLISNLVQASLPKWDSTNGVSCHQFLSRMSQVLSTSDMPRENWYRLFPHTVTDIASGEWIQANIVEKQLTWNEAVIAFTARFQLSSNKATLSREFANCCQGKWESVQSYSSRFLGFMQQLNIDKNIDIIIQQYINNLSYRMQHRYIETMASVRITNPNYRVKNIQESIDICLSLDSAVVPEGVNVGLS